MLTATTVTALAQLFAGCWSLRAEETRATGRHSGRRLVQGRYARN